MTADQYASTGNHSRAITASANSVPQALGNDNMWVKGINNAGEILGWSGNQLQWAAGHRLSGRPRETPIEMLGYLFSLEPTGSRTVRVIGHVVGVVHVSGAVMAVGASFRSP